MSALSDHRDLGPHCERCDLPLVMCEHRPSWVEFAGVLRGQRRRPRPVAEPAQESEPLRPYFDSPDYRATWRHYVEADKSGQPVGLIACDHEHGSDRAICADCGRKLALLLADLPALAADLALAHSKETAFVEHGASPNGPDGAEAVRLPWSERASAALAALARLLGTGPSVLELQRAARAASQAIADRLRAPDAAQWATDLSRAALDGFRTIDRPPDLTYLGPCPGCGHHLYDERGSDVVDCPRCDYRRPAADHQRAVLQAGEEAMLTVSELVGAITRAGEQISRDQINGLIRRGGLPREIRSRAAWRKGRRVERTVWVYRLGDVLDLVVGSERRS